MNANNNALIVAGSTVEIAKEGDFRDLLKFSAPEHLAKVKLALAERCKAFGETRSAQADLFRMRLQQLRSVAV